jgi:integrase
LAEFAGTDFDALRDAAMIRLFADTGCRVGEIPIVTRATPCLSGVA